MMEDQQEVWSSEHTMKRWTICRRVMYDDWKEGDNLIAGIESRSCCYQTQVTRH